MKKYHKCGFGRRFGFCGVLALLGLLVASGCASWGDSESDRWAQDYSERARHGNLTDDSFEVRKTDLSGDDRPDQWTYVNEADQVVRVERDMNFNGRVDLWQYFDADGELVEEEMSIDRVGEVDVVAFYEDGRLQRQILSTEYDGTFPIEQFYDDEEELHRVERDSSGDGRVDVWVYYEDGERSRIGWDTTGDGQPDTFDQYD